VVPPEAEINNHQNGLFVPGLLLAIVEIIGVLCRSDASLVRIVGKPDTEWPLSPAALSPILSR
jgi:hypothetical protein